MSNGNGLIVKTAVGFGISVIIGAQTFAGNAIYKNRETNVQEHIEIRKDIASGDSIVRSEVNEVKDIVTNIRLEQRTMVETLKRIELK